MWLLQVQRDEHQLWGHTLFESRLNLLLDMCPWARRTPTLSLLICKGNRSEQPAF